MCKPYLVLINNRGYSTEALQGDSRRHPFVDSLTVLVDGRSEIATRRKTLLPLQGFLNCRKIYADLRRGPVDLERSPAASRLR